MVVGAPANVGDSRELYAWRLYEITNLQQVLAGQPPIVQLVANQPPAPFNNVEPNYLSDGSIVFVSDRPRNGAAALYPILDEYRGQPANSGLWRLDPATGALALAGKHAVGFVRSVRRQLRPRRVLALGSPRAGSEQRSGDGTADRDHAVRLRLGSGERRDRAARSTCSPSRSIRPPAAISTDSRSTSSFRGPSTRTAAARKSSIISAATSSSRRFARSYTNDGNLIDFDASISGRIQHEGHRQPVPDPRGPDHAGTLSRRRRRRVLHASRRTDRRGQRGVAIRAAGPAERERRQRHLHHRPADLHAVLLGRLVPVQHRPLPRSVADDRRQAGRGVRQYAGHRKAPPATAAAARAPTNSTCILSMAVSQNGATEYVPAASPLIAGGIAKSGLKYNYASNIAGQPSGTVNYTGALWELQPVEIVARAAPPSTTQSPLGGTPEQAVFDAFNLAHPANGVSVAQMQQFLQRQNLALVVIRNATSRDRADQQQPYNLAVPGGVSTISDLPTYLGPPLYCIDRMQFFEADQVRGFYPSAGTIANALPGRRPMPRPLNDANALANNMPATSQLRAASSSPRTDRLRCSCRRTGRWCGSRWRRRRRAVRRRSRPRAGRRARALLDRIPARRNPRLQQLPRRQPAQPGRSDHAGESAASAGRPARVVETARRRDLRRRFRAVAGRSRRSRGSGAMLARNDTARGSVMDKAAAAALPAVRLVSGRVRAVAGAGRGTACSGAGSRRSAACCASSASSTSRATRHTLRRNFPVTAHLRTFFEYFRPMLRQYFVESDTEEVPFSRPQRSIVYQRAKNVLDKRPFGTQLDVYADALRVDQPFAGADRDRQPRLPHRHRRPAVRAAVFGQRVQHLGDELRLAVGERDPRAQRRRAARRLLPRHRRRLDLAVPPRERRRHLSGKSARATSAAATPTARSARNASWRMPPLHK